MQGANKYVITMLGEKDHGKSTFIGNLLIATSTVSEERLSEAREHTKSGRFEPAHILDSFSEEREQEMTIDTTRAEIVQDGNIYEFIDVPGHLELIKNMVSGASNGDLAVLMVSTKPNEGFQPQTKRHVFLANLLGISSLIVAVNKMDTADYDQEIFNREREEIKAYLDAIGFGRPVIFVPISAYDNENIVVKSKKMKWYEGKPMLDVIKEFASNYGGRVKPKINGLRLFVQDAMESNGESILFGQIYSGTLSVNGTVRIEPSGVDARVLELHAKGNSVESVGMGTNVAIRLDRDKIAKRGDIITDKSGSPVTIIKTKLFLIKSLNVDSVSGLLLKFNNNDLAISSIVPNEIISPVSGKNEIVSNRLAENMAAVAKVSFSTPYLVERFDDLRELGRFGIFKDNDLVGIGIII